MPGSGSHYMLHMGRIKTHKRQKAYAECMKVHGLHRVHGGRMGVRGTIGFGLNSG